MGRRRNDGKLWRRGHRASPVILSASEGPRVHRATGHRTRQAFGLELVHVGSASADAYSRIGQDASAEAVPTKRAAPLPLTPIWGAIAIRRRYNAPSGGRSDKIGPRRYPSDSFKNLRVSRRPWTPNR